MRIHTFGAVIGLSALTTFGAIAALPAHAQVTVYSNNFQTGSTTGFSSSSISTTPGTLAHPADMFLGEFGNQTVTLGLAGLAAHTTATVNFDLYMIRSMDGEGQFGGGPDPWSLTVSGGPTLLATNFANFPGDTQQFQSQANPNAGGQAPQTGAAEKNTLGYTFNGTPMDAVYHFNYTFANSGSALSLNFIGAPNESLANESWGLDNVVVQTNAGPNATPEPGSVALLCGLGISGASLLTRRRKAKR